MKTEVKQIDVMFYLPTDNGLELSPFTVRELTVKELENLGRIGRAQIRKDWLAQVHEIAGGLPDAKERNGFLVSAAGSCPDIDSYYIPWLTGEGGIKAALTLAAPELAAKWADIASPTENAEPILQAWRVALGVPEPVEGEDSPLPEATQPA